MGYLCVAKGRVQGVGFRYHTLQLARKHHLTGWVRNDPQGTVTFEIYGAENNLSLFFDNLIKGNGYMRIDNLSKKDLPEPSPYKSFEIVY